MSLRQTPSWTQFRGNVLTTAPAIEPVTDSELRTFLRESETGLPDEEANDFIAEARQFIEEMTGLSLINQTWTMSLDRWPQSSGGQWRSGVRQGAVSELTKSNGFDSVHLPRYPLTSITSVTTYAEKSESTAVIVADVFDVDTAQRPGRLTLKSGSAWPTASRANNAIEIVYVAGFGATAADVPKVLRRAIKQLAAALYSGRGDGCSPSDLMGASGAASLVSAYTVRRL